MGDRPIIFSGPMVRALLAGTKTQTRRLVKPRGRRASLFDGSWSDSYVLDPGNADWRARDLPCAAGDRLYVREAWHVRGRYTDVVEVGYSASQRRSHTEYVEQFPVAVAVPGKGKWPTFPRSGPSIHMPRWASRLTLTVSDVRVQRLQDITEADALAEGVRPIGLGDGPNHYTVDIGFGNLSAPTAVETFRLLWNLLHGEEAWDANPWVVAIGFTVAAGNIDRIAA